MKPITGSIVALATPLHEDGTVDYPTLLKILHDSGYAGWLVVEAEQDPAKAHPLTYATMGYRNLYRLATAAGFTIDGLPPK